MNYRTRQQAESAMAAWAENTEAPALALVQAADNIRFRVLEADAEGKIVIGRAETVVDTTWAQHSGGVADLRFVNAYSVSFGSALWQMHQASIQVPHGATDLAAALEEAMAAANDSSDWETADDTGPTFVDALAEGEGADPWSNDARDRIPKALTEEGPLPIVLIRMAGGRIDDVKMLRGEAHVVALNRDGEALDRGPHVTVQDDQGELLLTHWTGASDLSSLPKALIDELGLSAPSNDPTA